MSSVEDTWSPSARQRERDAYRKRQGLRSLLIAGLSTLVIGGALITAVMSAPGWERTRTTFFNWDKAVESFPAVLAGFWINVQVFAVSALCVLIVGMALAVLKTLRGPVFWPLRALATVYVDVFRGLPLILVLLLVGFGVPALNLTGVPTDPIVLGCVALVLTYSAYVAEVFRAGIESVHPSQRAAARSLGLSGPQSMRYVVLPQAVRRVVPPLLNDLASLTKDSGLISVLGAAIDAVRAAQIETATSFNFTPYVVAGALFLVLTIPLTRLTDRAARRYGAVPGGGHL
ncbi:amino acid ABC transporter permease [Kineosporia sp. NBRC 101731]|uniref:amino acid ABC transporter permease n=1 Tax=Kineosporia sp. NBRC 101731 TaxID=3032199 RepID=UPI0024A05CE2|nr:amino acid ABC transporter permease [Kineosporia sp. NBRC 101731]GLY27634.1 ABC transporter permease [Kineosporia sp. NBRC 101731]